MARWLCVALCVIATASISSQVPANQSPFFDAGSSVSPRLAQLKAALSRESHALALKTFWEDVRREGTPLIEPVSGEPNYSWVTFLWQAVGKTANVAVVDGVAAGVGGADATKSLMFPLDGTDVWYRTYKVRNDAAFTYTLSPNDSLEKFTGPRKSKPQIDPLNPSRSGPQSLVRLPSAPPLTENASAPAGAIAFSSITSTILRNSRSLQVYTPPGFTTAAKYPLLVVLDAGAYADFVPVPKILDTLIAEKRIAPMVAVLVGNANRAEELPCSPQFADFLATELLPWMRETYSAGATPDRTIVAGSSLGGLASMFAGFRHPETFGNVLSESGSYWWSPPNDPQPEWLTRQITASAKTPVRISMSVGAMEIPEQLGTNRRLRDRLTEKGYFVDYSEFNGNHSYIGWRTDLARRLVNLAPSPSGQ